MQNGFFSCPDFEGGCFERSDFEVSFEGENALSLLNLTTQMKLKSSDSLGARRRDSLGARRRDSMGHDAGLGASPATDVMTVSESTPQP